MTDTDRLITPARRPEDVDAALRPRTLEEFVGQKAARENLRVFIEAAKARGDALDHVLFFGPPGLGKTTLAQIIAREMGVGFRSTSGPVIVKSGDLAALLTNLEDGDVLFIDEIHRLAPPVEEVLYPAMEDYQLDILIGKGPAARSIRLEIPRFTLVGATTRTGLLTSPLRDRFGFVSHLDYYQPAELEAIITRSAAILGIAISEAASVEIAARSRGTPRVANRLLRRVRDYAQVRADGRISLEVARDALALFEVDGEGLDKVDKAILLALTERFCGRPVGLTTLAAAVGEEPDTIEDVYEPYLLRKGFLQRTPRGRVATATAFQHLGVRSNGESTLL